MQTDRVDRIISRAIGRQVQLSDEETRSAGQLLRQAVVAFHGSRRASERRAGDALQTALLGAPLRWDHDFTRAMRLLRSPRQPWVAELNNIYRNAASQHYHSRQTLAGPSRRWLTTDQAAALTGYCVDHIRYVLRKHSEVARRVWSGQLLVRRRDIQAYTRKQKKRGYGPR